MTADGSEASGSFVEAQTDASFGIGERPIDLLLAQRQDTVPDSRLDLELASQIAYMGATDFSSSLRPGVDSAKDDLADAAVKYRQANPGIVSVGPIPDSTEQQMAELQLVAAEDGPASILGYGIAVNHDPTDVANARQLVEQFGAIGGLAGAHVAITEGKQALEVQPVTAPLVGSVAAGPETEYCGIESPESANVPVGEAIPIAPPQITASADVRKFSDYIFAPGADHGKDVVFTSLGYSANDSELLASMYEQQASEAFANGQYTLGRLDQYGQRVSIEIALPVTCPH